MVGLKNAHVLTEKVALHMRALRTFRDDLSGTLRRNGDEFLVKMADTESYIPSVSEEVVKLVDITTLTNRQYAVIVNPVDSEGHPQLGKKRLVKGPDSFFLMPGEELEAGIQDVYVLSEDEGLILRACESFTDQDVERTPGTPWVYFICSPATPCIRTLMMPQDNFCPFSLLFFYYYYYVGVGDRWMIKGPLEYVPPVQVEVVTKRHAIPLDLNEGIYIRDLKSGKVRAICGQTYMVRGFVKS